MKNKTNKTDLQKAIEYKEATYCSVQQDLYKLLKEIQDKRKTT